MTDKQKQTLSDLIAEGNTPEIMRQQAAWDKKEKYHKIINRVFFGMWLIGIGLMLSYSLLLQEPLKYITTSAALVGSAIYISLLREMVVTVCHPFLELQF